MKGKKIGERKEKGNKLEYLRTLKYAANDFTPKEQRDSA
jgi:hypothetical protein